MSCSPATNTRCCAGPHSSWASRAAAWVRERVYALLCRSYADELSPLTDASIRDNATMLLKELKTKDAGR